ncbi:MAG TPA: hypothetical protein DD856_14470 [Sulfobacillus sp.]|nr:hypothetical protein [Sulfobacillus sp.]
MIRLHAHIVQRQANHTGCRVFHFQGQKIDIQALTIHRAGALWLRMLHKDAQLPVRSGPRGRWRSLGR